MPTKPTASAPVEYRALTGLNYGPTDKRVEAMEKVTDLPAESVPWLLEQGYIRLVADEPPDVPDTPPIDPLLEDGGDPAVVAADTGNLPDADVDALVNADLTTNGEVV